MHGFQKAPGVLSRRLRISLKFVIGCPSTPACTKTLRCRYTPRLPCPSGCSRGGGSGPTMRRAGRHHRQRLAAPIAVRAAESTDAARAAEAVDAEHEEEDEDEVACLAGRLGLPAGLPRQHLRSPCLQSTRSMRRGWTSARQTRRTVGCASAFSACARMKCAFVGPGASISMRTICYGDGWGMVGGGFGRNPSPL